MYGRLSSWSQIKMNCFTNIQNANSVKEKTDAFDCIKLKISVHQKTECLKSSQTFKEYICNTYNCKRIDRQNK